MTLLDEADIAWRVRPRAPLTAEHLRLLLEEAAAAMFEVPAKKLRARSRGCAQVAFARQSAMYLAHVALGLSYSDVGKLFGRDRTTAAHACQLVEDRRDRHDIDLRLDFLETVFREAIYGIAPPVAPPVAPTVAS